MFLRYEIVLIYYKGSVVINLGVDFILRDLVNN